MKKNLLLYGVFLCALSISSCSGGSKSSHVMDSSSMSVENANEVMKYYDTSLKILKDLVNENEIKAVLGYLDQKMPVDSLPVVSQPVVSVQDTVFVSNPEITSVRMIVRIWRKIMAACSGLFPHFMKTIRLTGCICRINHIKRIIMLWRIR